MKRREKNISLRGSAYIVGWYTNISPGASILVHKIQMIILNIHQGINSTGNFRALHRGVSLGDLVVPGIVEDVLGYNGTLSAAVLARF